MKRLTWRFKRWLNHRCKPKRKLEGRFGELTTQHGTHRVRLSRAVNLPANLCLEENLEETLSFLVSLRYRTLLHGIPTNRPHPKRIAWVRGYTDFTTMRHITPGAALILAAEYDRINRVGSSIPNTIDIKRWDPLVYSTLYHLGFFELLGVANSGSPNRSLPSPEESNLVQAPMQRGENANWEGASEALLNLFDLVGGDDAARVNLLGAVVDAIENVRGHAYSGRTPLETRLIPPFWWLSGAADQASRKLTLAIYDQGLTIPVTLPNKWAGSMVLNAFLKLFGHSFDPERADYDGKALKAAMQLSSTATGLTQRGKGLSKIRDVVSQCNDGRLKVISRRGIYGFENGTETFRTGSIPLLGTLIEIEATF
jgi:hypothetical protein